MRYLDETGLVAFWNKIKQIILDNEEVTAVSLNNLNDRVTSIGDDLENKADKSIIPTALSDLGDDASHRLVTDDEKTTWNAKVGKVELDKYNSDATESNEGTPANGQTDVKVDNVSIGTVVTSYAPGTAQRPYVAPSWYALNTKLSGKQDTISDLDTIRSGANKGATALQPTDIAVTQSPSTGTSTIQVNDNPAYTLVSDSEPSGSANGYVAPSWGAMTTALNNKVDTTIVEENELVTSAALNDLNSRINNLNTEKQNILVSGTDVKTINNQSILGSGNIDITSDLGDSLVAMFSKLDEITPVRTIEFDVAATTGQIIYSRANVTEDALLNNVTDTLIYSIEVSGNSNSNIYDQYKVYVHFQPCAQRSPITFIEHICKNPASSPSLYGLKLLTYFYPKAINNGYPWICYLTASSTDSRHVKIRVYQDSSNVDWKNPAVPVAVTAGLYNTTYQTKGSEMTIISTGWITNGITQASSATATISTSLPKNFVGSIYQAGEALTGDNLVYRALNDGKIYRVGTLTATINDVSTNLTLDPMFGVSRIVNSRAINANIVASDLDYKRSINPSTPNNGSSFQIETGWTKGDTMYYKCTQSGTSLIPTGHITTTLTPGYAYFPIGVINSASSLDFDCIGHEFITLNASGKVTHVNGLEIAGGSGGGGSQDLSDYVKYSNTISSTDPNGSCSSSETIEGNSMYTSGSQQYTIAPGYTISLDVQSDAYTTYIINNTSPKAILASGIGDIEWTNATSSDVTVQVGSGTSGQYYIATVYLKGYTEEVGEIKEKVESINGVQVLPLSMGAAMLSVSIEDNYVNLDESVLPSNYIQRITIQLDNILSFYHQNLYNPLYIQLMNDLNDFDNPVPYVTSSCMYLGNNNFSITTDTNVVEFKKNGQQWQIIKTKETYNKVCINGSNDNIYAPDTSGIINLPLKTVNNQQIFGSGNILTTNAPLLEKTYENYTCAAANIDKGYIYFMNVVPTSDNYYEPWYVHYILEITTSVNQCQGYYEITMGSAGTTSQYRHFNRLYSASYIPTYYHLMAWHNSAAKYANKATYPIKLGERIYSAYGTTTVARTYNIKVIDMYNCTVTFPDNIETYDSFYSDSNYGYNSYWNAYSNGGMDNWDANTVPYQYYEHYPQYYIHNAQTPLYRYKICGFDDDNRLVPVTITNRTSAAASTLTPCKVPMAVSRGLIYYASTTNITDPTVLTANGAIYRGNEVGIEYFRYNFDTLPGNNQSVYLKGTYTISTDTFVLDDDYYVFVPTNVTSSSYSTYFTEGKYYWYIGRTGNYSTANYGGFNLNNPLYQFNGSKLVPITSIISSSGGGGDTNVIETVKVNGTALTPDANKAVDITVPSGYYYDNNSDEHYTALGDSISENITYLDDAIFNNTPLKIYITDTPSMVPSGTYTSISQALAEGRDIIIVRTITNSDSKQYLHITINGDGSYTYQDQYLFSVVEGYANTQITIDGQDGIYVYEYVSPPESHTHGNIKPNGALQTTDVTIANGDKLVVTDASNSNKVARASLTFDGSTTIQALSKKGTWETFYQIPAGGIPTSDLAVDPITSVTMNGNVVQANTGGAINLGTVITSHQSIKTINNNVITGTGNVTIATPGILKSDNTTAQTTANNESLSGIVNLHKISKTGNYNDLIDKPTIPAAVTESTVSGWGFTKNTGTITGITMNGTSKGTSGVINLGTVLTAHQDISGKANTADLATVATSGSYNDLSNKPTIPNLNTNQFTVGQGITSLNSATGSQINELNDLSQAGDNTFPTSTAVYNAIVAAINAAKVTIYSGTAAPSSSQGTNGDLYLQTS